MPSQFQESLYASGLYWPTALAFAPDGRLFVTEQIGRLRVIKNGSLLATPFLTVNVNSSGERGLLGVAFDPNFATNRYLYIYYTATAPTIHNRVSRFTASAANPDVAEPGSETVLLDLPTLGPSHHNGGAMHFKDGKLYIATGDNKNSANAQSLSTPLGKILRIDPHGVGDALFPSDNPFYTTTTGINRAIWAFGLRNPFRFAIQPGTGKILINVVGENKWEEINEGVAGANYGWPTTEGPTTDARFRSPLFAYSHGRSDTLGCAITGGVFYNPPTVQFPQQTYLGKYFFTDYCSGRIRVFDPVTRSNPTIFARSLLFPVDLTVGVDGSLYYMARGNGTQTGVIYRIRYTGTQTPQISQHPVSQTVSEGQSVTFTVAASGTPPLSYQWQREQAGAFANIPGATSPSYTLVATAADSGARFRCIVSNVSSVPSDPATLTVLIGSPPVGTITSPAAGTLYSAGETIHYAATGSDAEDGTLPQSAFSWRADLHHGTGASAHTHTTFDWISGSATGTFQIPTADETDADVFYRLYLRVIDSHGNEHISYRDLQPRKVMLTFDTAPSGLSVTLDGRPRTTPLTVEGVVGVTRHLDAPSPQTLTGVNYEFVAWSDGGAGAHSISTPATDTAYTATYRVSATTIGNGDGLRGVYYNNADFTGTTVTRVDPTVNFDWGNGAPAPGIHADTFSVLWTGQIQAQFSEDYTFYTVSDEGIRLEVDGVVLIDSMIAHSVREDRSSRTLRLVAGQKYTITIRYYERYSRAVAKLLWSSPSTPKAAVPQSQLYSQNP
jgi:glucose/arabinose dehydrogenase